MKKKRTAPRASGMTAADVKKIRARLGLTPSQFAARVGVHRVTVHAWEAGRQKIGAAYAKLLRLIETMQK